MINVVGGHGEANPNSTWLGKFENNAERVTFKYKIQLNQNKF